MTIPKPQSASTSSEVYSPQVNEFVEMQQALRRDTGPIDPQPLLIRVIYSSWFYLSIASGLGAVLGWAVLEPFFDDTKVHMHDGLTMLIAIFLFPVVAAAIGLFLAQARESCVVIRPGHPYAESWDWASVLAAA